MTRAPIPKPDVTTPAVTPPAPAPLPVASAEDKKAFLQSLNFRPAEDEPVVETPKPGETTPPTIPKPTEEPAATPAPTEEPPRGKGGKFVKRTEVDPVAIKTAIKEGMAEAAAAALPPTPVVPEPDTLDDRAVRLKLSKADRKTLDAAKWLQENRPEDFKGRTLDEELVKFWEAEEAYKSNWEKKHKGEEWDPASDDHSEFYAREPKIDEDSLAEAKEQLLRESVKRDVHREMEPELNRVKLQHRLREIEPALKDVQAQAIIDFVEKADPEMAKAMKVGDKTILNNETIEKMRVSNPQVFEFLSTEAFVLKNVVAEIEKLGQLGELYQPNFDLVLVDPDTGKVFERNGKPIHVHSEIVDFAMTTEREFSNAPAEKQKWNGKTFISMGDLMTKRADIAKSRMSMENKAKAYSDLSEKYWHITTPMLKGMYVSQVAKGVKKQLDFARKLGGVSSAARVEAPPAPAPAPVARRTAPPTTESRSEVTTTRVPAVAGANDSTKEVLQSFFPKS